MSYRLEKTITSTGEKEVLSQNMDLSMAQYMKLQAEIQLQETIALCDERKKINPDIENLNLTYNEDLYPMCPIEGTFEIVEEI